MPDAFKNWINPTLIALIAHHLHRVWPAFDQASFIESASQSLETLELKQRVEQVSHALDHTLPAQFEHAASVLTQSLAPAAVDDNLGQLVSNEDGLAGWAIWPLSDYIARHGLPYFDCAMTTLHAMTQRATAEFAIRPFIAAEPERALSYLMQWTQDPSAHVRRLVSEGTRPRLPWGLRLQQQVQDPSPILPLLTQLKNDPSEYVRRSVANHLNDISKDHPALATQIAADWLAEARSAASNTSAPSPDATQAIEKLIRHALRGLIKQGNPEALSLLGYAVTQTVTLCRWTCQQDRVVLGQDLTLSIALSNPHTQTVKVAVDYVVFHQKANGERRPKVFKWTSLVLAPGEVIHLQKQHRIVPITTRRYYAGQHDVAIQLNGQRSDALSFELIIP